MWIWCVRIRSIAWRRDDVLDIMFVYGWIYNIIKFILPCKNLQHQHQTHLMQYVCVWAEQVVLSFKHVWKRFFITHTIRFYILLLLTLFCCCLTGTVTYMYDVLWYNIAFVTLCAEANIILLHYILKLSIDGQLHVQLV